MKAISHKTFNKMDYEQKTDFFIKNLSNAQMTNASSKNEIRIKIYFDGNLSEEAINDIERILNWLEHTNRLFDVLEFDYPSSYFNGKAKNEKITLLSLKVKFIKDIQNWQNAYLFEKNQKLEDLDPLQLENIYNTVLDIDDRLGIKPSTQVTIKLNQECRFPLLDEKCDGLLHSAEFRQDALTFLTRKDIIIDFKLNDSDDADITITLTINFDNFLKFKTEIKKIYDKNTQAIPRLSSKLPSNTRWEDIAIKFINEEYANVTINNKTSKHNFRDMGFEDKRNGTPNKQWKFLYFLAKGKGQISWKNFTAKLDVKKKKQLLSNTLKEYFEINDDPFFSYKNEKSYTIKIQLLPD